MKQKGKMSGKKLKQMFVTYTFVLPDFIGLLVFIIIPIIYSFYMSLYDWNFANIKQFIGIQNYVTMFSDSEWWQSLGRTFKLTLLYVPALFILSILFAVLINYVKNEKAAGFVKTAFLLPYSIGSSTLARNKNYYKPQKCGLFYVKFYLFLCCTGLYFIFICDIMRYETQL